MRRSGWVPLACFSLVLLAAPRAEAESGRFNVHLQAGVLAPPTGMMGSAIFDWQLARPVALEVAVGGGFLVEPGVPSGPFGEQTTDVIDGVFTATFGARFRVLDDQSGYPEEGGSVHGQLWIAPHAGVAVSAVGPAFLFDVAVGYELSIAAPVSLGVYVRPIFLVTDRAFGALFDGGITMSFEIDPLRDAPAPPPPPVDPDPDHDGILTASDRCPRTPEGAEVDARGCVPVPRVLVLEGINFAFDSATIEPSSQSTLERAVQLLAEDPEVRVEIGGHTDDIGGVEHNEQLSRERAQAVADWLIANGIERERLTVRGYGASQPRVPNSDETSRAQNRRIEFRVLD